MSKKTAKSVNANLKMAHPDAVFEEMETRLDKLTKKVGTRTMAIRVDITTYNNLKIMAGDMTLAGFLRLFSSGNLVIGEVAGYDQPTMKDLKSVLDHIANEQDKDAERIAKALEGIRQAIIDQNTTVEQPEAVKI